MWIKDDELTFGLRTAGYYHVPRETSRGSSSLHHRIIGAGAWELLGGRHGLDQPESSGNDAIGPSVKGNLDLSMTIVNGSSTQAMFFVDATHRHVHRQRRISRSSCERS